MKLIAHRGASLEAQEDTLESLNLGAALGAYAVECDPRLTKDDRFVLFHDDDLVRLGGVDALVRDVTYDEMKTILAKKGLSLTTLDELASGYTGDAYVLFDFSNGGNAKPYPLDDALLSHLARLPFRVICGVHRVEEAAAAARYFPAEQILAFAEDGNHAAAYAAAGAGNYRLWQWWLDEVSPADVKAQAPGLAVWIMSATNECGMNGRTQDLDRFAELGVDGVLLNNIRMAVAWSKRG